MSTILSLRTADGREYPIAGVMRLGRGTEAQIQLSDGLVSRLHATVWPQADGLLIRDEDSSNGTAINGSALRPNEIYHLRLGDTLRVGGTAFTVAAASAAASAKPSPQPRPSPAAPVAPTNVLQPQSPAPSRRPVGLLLALGAAGVGLLVLLVAGLAIAGFFYIRSRGTGPVAAGPTATGPASGQPTSFQQQAVTPAHADGATVTDANGVSLTAPAGSAETGDVLHMTSYKVSGALAQALASQYDVKLPFYAITAPGKNGSARSLSLSFPAPSPQSRIVALINQRYPVLLAVEPVNGQLTVTGMGAPEDLSDVQSTGPFSGGVSIAYTVITPKAGAASVQPDVVQPAHGGQASTMIDCNPVAARNMSPSIDCRRNAAGTIIFSADTSYNFTDAETDTVIQELARRMNAYAAAGFTAGTLTRGDPLKVIIAASGGDPQYTAWSSIIYLPEDVARDIPGKGKLLSHEMGHWIQGHAYHMVADYYSGYKHWWLEISAENMVMVIQPDYIKFDLDTFGAVTGKAGESVLQDAPYQYPSDTGSLYSHSQLVMLNMCANAQCPLSQPAFVTAINDGTFPFDNDQAKALVDQNMRDYALYLAGAAPQKANSGISLAGVQSQTTYGQTAAVRQFHSTAFFLQYDGPPPQTVKQQKNGLDSLTINAPLQKDGVFPLAITSGDQGKFLAQPAMLTVAPGAPFVYRLDGGAPQFSDGSQPVLIGPINSKLGITSVRLAAYSATGNQTFSAHLDLIDLTGAWIVQTGGLVSNNVTCSGPGSPADSQSLAPLFPEISNALAAIGNMQPDATGPTLTWSLVPARLPPDTKATDFMFNATGQINTDNIQLPSTATFPEKQTSTSPAAAAALGLALLAAIPVYPLARRLPGPRCRQAPRRPALLLLSLMTAAMLLTGCIGVDAYGTATGQVNITGLTYVGGKDKAVWTVGKPIATQPVWAFTQGTATYTLDYKISTTTQDANNQPVKQTDTCTGTIVYNITGGVYPDVEIVQPKQ